MPQPSDGPSHPSPTFLRSGDTGAGAARAVNFSAGPATLPEDVLRQAMADLWDIDGTGIGMMEHSHRGKVFDRVTAEAEAHCRELASVPDDYDVFWMQGGATTQCALVPANLLPEGGTADYFQTGKWANDSINEVHHYGTVHVCGSSKATNYDRIPTGEAVRHSESPAYVHFTSNNTIVGTKFWETPAAPGSAFLVRDATSDVFSEPIDVSEYGLVYAGAQKNLGLAGVVLLIGRRGLMRSPVRSLPTMLSYETHASSEGRFNTPPTFGVYFMDLMFRWILERGGLSAMGEMNREKADLLYGFLDSEPFYRPHAVKRDRSMMNATFKCPTEELDALFVAEAEKLGLKELKGHRSVGGMRASMYNSMPRSGVERLVAFMKDFAHEHAGSSVSAARATGS